MKKETRSTSRLGNAFAALLRVTEKEAEQPFSLSVILSGAGTTIPA